MGIACRVREIIFPIILSVPRKLLKKRRSVSPAVRGLPFSSRMTNGRGSSANPSYHHSNEQHGMAKPPPLLRVKWLIPMLYYSGNVEAVHPIVLQNTYIITISIIPDSRINAVTSFHRVCFEQKVRMVYRSQLPDTEYVILVFQWKIHIVFAVFKSNITVPKADGPPKEYFP